MRSERTDLVHMRKCTAFSRNKTRAKRFHRLKGIYKDCFGKNPKFLVLGLHTRWVQHNADLSSNSLRRQIPSESAPDDTTRPVRSTDLSPVHSEFIAKLIGGLGLGNECNLLAKVKVSICLAVYTLNFDQSNTVVLGSKTALVAEEGSFNMKLWWSGRHDNYCLTNKKEKQAKMTVSSKITRRQ